MARSIEEIQNDIAKVDAAIKEIKARKENRGQFSSEQIAQMYSLDPKAAEFFANKQAQEELYKIKRIPKKETDEAKIRLIQTALNREKKNLDDAIKAFGQNSPQAIRANNLVKELTVEMQSEDPKVSNAYARAGIIFTDNEQKNLEGIDAIKDSIKNATYDKDGIIENRDLIVNSIEDWRIKNNISVEDPSYKGLIKLLEDKDEDKVAIANGIAEREKEATRVKEREEDEWIKVEDEYGQLANGIVRFAKKAEPTKSDIATLINLTLRKETGAAIASDETKNFISMMLPPDKATSFSKEWDKEMGKFMLLGNAILGPLGTALSKITGKEIEVAEIYGLASVVDKYMGAVNPARLLEYSKDAISQTYKDNVGKFGSAAQKKYWGDSTSKNPPPNPEPEPAPEPKNIGGFSY